MQRPWCPSQDVIAHAEQPLTDEAAFVRVLGPDVTPAVEASPADRQ
jgi:hypothetical protein